MRVKKNAERDREIVGRYDGTWDGSGGWSIPELATLFGMSILQVSRVVMAGGRHVFSDDDVARLRCLPKPTPEDLFDR